MYIQMCARAHSWLVNLRVRVLLWSHFSDHYYVTHSHVCVCVCVRASVTQASPSGGNTFNVCVGAHGHVLMTK